MDKIAILDFGSQFSQLIARRLREQNVYCQLFTYDVDIEKIKEFNPKGIILSGGPSSVHDKDSPHRDLASLIELAPTLGICYGMQLICHQLGGEVKPSDTSEYGMAYVNWSKHLGDVPSRQKVWMSHGDTVSKLPNGFEVVAETHNKVTAAICSDRVWGLQFHPEVSHTEYGNELIRGFVKHCDIKPDWTPEHILVELENKIKYKVPEGEKVLCALSGGVDSTVVGTLLTNALGADRVQCVFIDNGLLRKNEFEEVLEIYNGLGLNVDGVNAKKEFLTALAGVEDPETKRKIIGAKFIEVFEKEVGEHKDIKWLAQGTLYPDVIESVNLRGSSVTIKSHHNVGGLPEHMNLKLIEPLRELFKDEVRQVGFELNIPPEVLGRHPFPGPGLAIRLLGAVNETDLNTLKDCDAIYIDALKKEGLYNKIWQAGCILLPVRTVGVQGDARTYEKTLAIRAVTSNDGMTADWFDFPAEFLRKVSNRITNEVKTVNRVVYDVTSKPPGTIEWE